MGRSKKKGPYVDLNVLEKVMKQKKSGVRDAIRTWARACMIVPEFVGHNFSIHTGNKFTAVFVTEGMVGHKLGEFAMTRNYHSHNKNK
ncbi:MAG: 30S ribosomal protein S19 [Planctomycetota bacterium]|jgi:small subunit ribosomal protein S19|nr:30S ribosomal protein S19 [Planctomycetota bacterium]